MKESVYKLGLIVLALVFLFPLALNIDKWGDSDWYPHLAWTEASRRTIIDYHQIPLWNPYHCGGNVLMGNPESRFLFPTNIAHLIFGTIVGAKLDILAHLLIGLFGMFYLGKKYYMNNLQAFFSASIFCIGGSFAIRVASGHSTFMSMMILPWILLFFLRIEENKNYIFATSFALTLMLFDGGAIYLGLSVAFLFVLSIKNKLKGLKIFSLIIILVLLMGAIKILPIIDVIIEKPRILHIEESFSPFTIIKAFVSRDIQLFTPTEGKMWLEFGNYIGIVPFILFLIGSIQLWKKHKDLIVTAWLFIILSHGGVIWKVINQIPGYSFFQTPSRFLLISLICIALISGIYIKRFNYKICLIITLVVVVDLLIVNGVHIRNSFQIEPINITESDMFYQSYSPEMKTYDLIAALSGIGSVTCYESFLIKNAAKEGLIFYHRGHAIDIRDSAYLGEAHSENKNVKIKTWTPNKILLGSPKAIINQNYHRGWQQSTEANGLIETNGPITFYLPKSFIFGSLISFITITFSLYRIRRFSS